MIDADFEQPDGEPIRPWDLAREYVETYPIRVPPQFVVAEQCHPELADQRHLEEARRYLRRNKIRGLLTIAFVLGLFAFELTVLYSIAATSARLFRLRLLG